MVLVLPDKIDYPSSWVGSLDAQATFTEGPSGTMEPMTMIKTEGCSTLWCYILVVLDRMGHRWGDRMDHRWGEV